MAQVISLTGPSREQGRRVAGELKLHQSGCTFLQYHGQSHGCKFFGSRDTGVSERKHP